jgi:hypothetical protein
MLTPSASAFIYEVRRIQALVAVWKPSLTALFRGCRSNRSQRWRSRPRAAVQSSPLRSSGAGVVRPSEGRGMAPDAQSCAAAVRHVWTA